MENTNEIMKRVKKKKGTSTKSSQSERYECDTCKDEEFIFNDDGSVTPCKCVQIKRIKKMCQRDGIYKKLEGVDLRKIEPKNKQQKQAIEKLKKYVDDFDNSNLGLLGKSGTGKTHLTLAVMKELLFRKKIMCQYVSYRDMITDVSANKFDQVARRKAVDKYTNPEVLLIDDLFKASVKNDGSVANYELEVVFDVINTRYNQKKPIIFSSELNANQLRDVDIAIFGRLLENSNYIIYFDKNAKNIRLNNKKGVE